MTLAGFSWWAIDFPLALDDLGGLFLIDFEGGSARVGQVGDEPRGCETQARWLAAEWRDATSIRDERAEWSADYKRNLM